MKLPRLQEADFSQYGKQNEVVVKGGYQSFNVFKIL